MKIAVLNDLHPAEMAGAASISFELARQANKGNKVEYWCASNVVFGNHDAPFIVRRGFTPKNSKGARGRNLPTKIRGEIFPNFNSVWLLFQLIRTAPDVLWIHQIGNRFPKSSILFGKLLNVRTIVTVHDFGYILPRKLYPRDIGINHDDLVDEFAKGICESGESRELELSNVEHKWLLALRLKIVRFILNKADEIVYISQLQSHIYSNFGFNEGSVIPNGVALCECDEVGETKIDNSILFAGRHVGKGFENLVDSVQKNPSLLLYIAGDKVLFEIASAKIPQANMFYLGKLTQDQLFKEMHRIQYVSVISECFDVYPTITLEALRHGATVLTTLVTGNANLVSQISENYIAPYNKPFDLNKIHIADQERVNSRIKLDENVISVETSFDLYAAILN